MHYLQRLLPFSIRAYSFSRLKKNSTLKHALFTTESLREIIVKYHLWSRNNCYCMDLLLRPIWRVAQIARTRKTYPADWRGRIRRDPPALPNTSLPSFRDSSRRWYCCCCPFLSCRTPRRICDPLSIDWTVGHLRTDSRPRHPRWAISPRRPKYWKAHPTSDRGTTT